LAGIGNWAQLATGFIEPSRKAIRASRALVMMVPLESV
jgi:hypothetical protein